MNEEHARAQVEAALEAILADNRFAASPQMSAFLTYVVRRTLDGGADRIKAYTIGVDALGKPESFDPQTDPSVRVLAKRLRSSLCDYHERHPDVPLVIEIRCGSYRPLFLPPASGEATTKAGTTRTVGASGEECRSTSADRARPAVPVIHVASGHRPGSLGAQLCAIVSGILTRFEGLQIVRSVRRDETSWPEDYELALETIRLSTELRVELQLAHAADGVIVHAGTVRLGAADAESPGEVQLSVADIETIRELAANLVHPHGALLSDYRSRTESATARSPAVPGRQPSFAAPARPAALSAVHATVDVLREPERRPNAETRRARTRRLDLHTTEE